MKPLLQEKDDITLHSRGRGYYDRSKAGSQVTGL